MQAVRKEYDTILRRETSPVTKVHELVEFLNEKRKQGVQPPDISRMIGRKSGGFIMWIYPFSALRSMAV